MSFQTFGFRALSSAVGIAVLTTTSAAFAAPGDVIVGQVPDPSSGGDVIVNPDGGTIGVPTTDARRFICVQGTAGQFNVMYAPESQPGQMYAWANPRQMGGTWTPQARCNAIADRLEAYRQDGLQELRTGVENGYSVVCATTQVNPGCRIVFTVPNGQNALATRDAVFQNLLVAENGQQTTAVNTFTGNGGLGNLLGKKPKAALSLKPFLDKKDGGTGERMKRLVAQPAAPKPAAAAPVVAQPVVVTPAPSASPSPATPKPAKKPTLLDQLIKLF